MKISFEDLDKKELSDLEVRTKDNSKLIAEIVNSRVLSVTDELDKIISKISNLIEDRRRNIDNSTLEYYLMLISTQLYYVSDNLEDEGIKVDVSDSIYKESFAQFFSSTKGTIEDKKHYAEHNCKYEYVNKFINDRVYKKVKSKLERATEIMSSLKKILSRRISEIDITRMSNDREFDNFVNERRNKNECIR